MDERRNVLIAMDRLLAAAGLSRSTESSSAGAHDVRSVWTAVAGARMHHLEAGSGSVVVLLHGGTGGGANWFRMIGPLAKRFRVLAPDLPGFGLSDAIEPVLPLGVTAADGLLEWMSHNDIRDALFAGTSFGGLVTLRLAQRTARITRVLLLDSAGLGRRIHPVVRIATGLPFTGMFVSPGRRGTAAVVRLLLTRDLTTLPRVQQRLLIDYLYESACASGTSYIARTLRGFAGARGQREVLADDEMSELEQPVSIVWGERDRLLPVADARRVAALIPGASFRVLPHVGHSPNWEQPHAVIEAIIALASRARALPDGIRH